MKRTSRPGVKRTSRRAVAPHTCVVNAGGTCRSCGALMNVNRFHEYTGVRSNPRGKIGVTKEFAMLDGIGVVRDAAPKEQLSFVPPGMAKQIAKWPAGVYSFGIERSSVRRFPKATLGGAVTSTRIASQKSGGYHWVVDNRDGYPVLVRAFDPAGKTIYRVEEYAKKLARVPVLVEARRTKRTSRVRAV